MSDPRNGDETTFTSTASSFEARFYVHVETRAERLMRHSNFLAECAERTMERTGIYDEDVAAFGLLCEAMDEFAKLSRLFEVIDAGEFR